MSLHPLKLELLIPPQWARVDRVRQAVAICVGAVFADTDLEDSLAMTSAELLENAIKYGVVGDARVVFALFHDGEAVTIEVTNSSSLEGAAALRERLDWLASFPSASDAYGAALAAVAERGSVGGDASGLGLVRIAYEGGCNLSCTLVDGQLTMRARRPCPPPPSGFPAELAAPASRPLSHRRADLVVRGASSPSPRRRGAARYCTAARISSSERI